MDQDVVKRFRRLFRGAEDLYGQWCARPDGTKDTERTKTVHKPVPHGAWEAHLEGADPLGPILGVVPLTIDNSCYFGAIDWDDDATDHAMLAQRVEEMVLPLTVCRSKSGGAHLYAFFSEPVPAQEVIDKLKGWRTALNIDANPDGRPVEVFPKQARTRKSVEGNWINLPYYGGEQSDRYAVVKGERLGLAEFLNHAEGRRLSRASLLASRDSGDNPFEAGPPCLQTLHDRGWTEGSRNQGLFNVALYLRLAHPDEWREMVHEFNAEHFTPPLGHGEVDQLIKSAGDSERTYVYKCNDHPLEPVCNKKLCVKRRYGIKAFRERDDDALMPEMSQLVKVKTDPPLWRLTLGGATLELSTEDLLMLPRFRRVALERATVVVPQIRQDRWDAKLRELLASHKVEEAPEDAGVGGEFRFLVGGFLQLRKASRTPDDVLMGKPYENGDGRVMFRAADLMTFLRRRGFRDYSTNKVYTALREMGATSEMVRLKGGRVNVWYLPTEDFDLQDEEFDTPERESI